MDILIAFLFMLVIALIAGLLLLFFSRLFAVEKNPLEKSIRECLPGINCGACGFKGCDDYASALAEKDAKPNLCIPGAQKVSDKLSEMLGLEKSAVEDVIAFVPCDGHKEVTHYIAKYNGIKTCRAAAMLYGGTKSCRYGCLGLGDCADACPSNAICMLDGVARIDTARCIGCGLCKQTCPKQVIVMLPREATAAVICRNKQKGAEARKSCENVCLGCKKCEKACEHGAITVKENLAVIDYEKCTYCGHCVTVCPTGCLKRVSFPSVPSHRDVKELVDRYLDIIDD